MKSWFDCSQVFSKLLIDSFIALRDNFVRVVNAAAGDAGHPCSHNSTALSPAVHTFSVEGKFAIVLIGYGENNVFRFVDEPFFFLDHVGVSK